MPLIEHMTTLDRICKCPVYVFTSIKTFCELLLFQEMNGLGLLHMLSDPQIPWTYLQDLSIAAFQAFDPT